MKGTDGQMGMFHSLVPPSFTVTLVFSSSLPCINQGEKTEIEMGFSCVWQTDSVNILDFLVITVAAVFPAWEVTRWWSLREEQSNDEFQSPH